jgi:uncharacterized membrane protein
MPEYVGRVDTGLPVFPDGAGKGSIFSPMKQDMDDGKMRAHAVQTILADAQTLYDFWRNVELAPRWQEFVVSVTATSDKVSHWVLGDPTDPKGKRVEYDSEIVEDVPGKVIAWNSVTEGIDEAGRVTFEPAPGGRGTRVTLQEFAKVPGGRLGNTAAGLAKRTPRQIVIEDLRHFKQLAETGEIPNVAHNPHGPRGLIGGFKERMYGETNPTPPGTSQLS